MCETRKQSVKQQDKTMPADVATASKKPTALNTTIVCDGEIKLPINGYSGIIECTVGIVMNGVSLRLL